MYWVHYFGGYLREENIQDLGETHRSDHEKNKCQIERVVCRKTDVLNTSFHIYHFNYCYFRHCTI